MASAITTDKDHLPLHYRPPPPPPSAVATKHASVPSLDALALLGLLALAGLLSTELLDRLVHSPSPDTTLFHPTTAHLHPFYSILAPITQSPGASVTVYVLPNWASVGVMVPGTDALTVHALADLSPTAAETGEWLLQLLQTSKELAWALPFLALCAMTAAEAQRRMRRMLGSSKHSFSFFVCSGATTPRAVLGAATCLLGYVLLLYCITPTFFSSTCALFFHTFLNLLSHFPQPDSLLLPFLALHHLPLLLADDLSLNPTDHPLLKGLSPQEVVYRFVHWEGADFIDDPGAVTIFR